MSYQAQIFKLLEQLTGQSNILTIPVAFIKYTGSRDTALLLSQLVYWTGRASHPDGWVFKTYAEWEEEICMNEYEVRKARKQLEDMGILETAVKKASGNPTVHYRINQEKLAESFLEKLQIGSLKFYRNEPANFAESLTEITTETTTKTSKTYTPSEPAVNIEAIPFSEIIDYLNKQTNSQYKDTTTSTRKHIRARWSEGHRLPDFITVIDKKAAEWLGTEQEKYLRPETLFGTKFEGYLNQKVRVAGGSGNSSGSGGVPSGSQSVTGGQVGWHRPGV